MSVIEHLQQLGFSEYEIKAYIALLQQHPLNGYALAKASGIPRPNVYGVLQKLEERGAVVAVNVAAGVLYSPIAPDRLIRLLSNHINEVLVAAKRELEALAIPVQQTYVQNIQGSDQLLDHARDLITSASERLLIALWLPEAAALAASLAQAQARSVVITTLCYETCEQECGGCQGSIYRYHVAPDQHMRQLIVIRDDTEMLIGTLGKPVTAIRTHQTSLIEMTTWYLRHSIALAAVLTDVGSTLEATLKPETRQILRVIGHGESWLEYMRQLVGSDQTSSK
jgi:HTH-type transcriptional regulator, sugar sensing transcriptional regulator